MKAPGELATSCFSVEPVRNCTGISRRSRASDQAAAAGPIEPAVSAPLVSDHVGGKLVGSLAAAAGPIEHTVCGEPVGGPGGKRWLAAGLARDGRARAAVARDAQRTFVAPLTTARPVGTKATALTRASCTMVCSSRPPGVRRPPRRCRGRPPRAPPAPGTAGYADGSHRRPTSRRAPGSSASNWSPPCSTCGSRSPGNRRRRNARPTWSSREAAVVGDRRRAPAAVWRGRVPDLSRASRDATRLLLHAIRALGDDSFALPRRSMLRLSVVPLAG
jgi:hypothetical protein